MKKNLLFVLAVVMIILTAPSVCVNAATFKVAKPTFTVSVSDKGTVKLTVYSSLKSSKILYRIASDEIYDNSKALRTKSGHTFTFSYKHASSICFKTYYKGHYSKLVCVDLGSYVEAQYNKEITTIVNDVTAGKDSDEEKLKAIWDWTMMNTKYASTGNGSADCNYYKAEDLIFSGKAVCNGFALLWIDMTKVIGIESHYIAVLEWDHAKCVTKVHDKWFLVDTTHNDKITNLNNISYDNLLSNYSCKYSHNYKGYDCSSKTYDAFNRYGDRTGSIFACEDDIANGTLIVTYDVVSDENVVTIKEDTDDEE